MFSDISQVPKAFADLPSYSSLYSNGDDKGLLTDHPDSRSGLIFNWRGQRLFHMDTICEFYDRLLRVPQEERTFFELVTEGPQKLRFVIVVNRNNTPVKDFNEKFANNLRDQVISYIHKYIAEEIRDYCLDFPDFSLGKDVIMVTFHDENAFNYQIVIDNFIFPSSIHCRLATQWVVDQLSPDLTKFVVLDVNNSNTLCYMVDNYSELQYDWVYFGSPIEWTLRSFNDPRLNESTKKYLCFERSLVTQVFSCQFHIQFPLPDYLSRPQLDNEQITQMTNQKYDLDKLSMMLPNGWFLSRQNGNMFSLEISEGAEKCPVCEQIHKQSKIIKKPYIFISSGDQCVYIFCYRLGQQKTRIGCLNPGYVDVIQQSNDSAAFITKHEITETAPGFMVNDYNRKHHIVKANLTYNHPHVQSIAVIPNKIILIESYLGTGKTSAIINYVRSVNASRVLILSPRMLYATSMNVEYNCNKSHLLPFQGEPFVCYSNQKENYVLTDDRLIIQIESLHRIHKEKRYDVLVLDEIEALLSQLSSTTVHQKVRCTQMFEQLIRTTPIIIGGDAFLSVRSTRVLGLLKEVFVIRNEHQPPVRKAIEVEDWTALVAEMRMSARNKLKFVLVCGSKAKLAEFEQICKDDEISYRIYSASQSIFKKDLENVNQAWSNVTCIGYTSSITVGVNFDIPDCFSRIFVYGSTKGCKARDTIQGTLRVRHLKENLMYFTTYSCPVNSKLPTKLQGIRDYIDRKISTYDQLIGRPIAPILTRLDDPSHYLEIIPGDVTPKLDGSILKNAFNSVPNPNNSGSTVNSTSPPNSQNSEGKLWPTPMTEITEKKSDESSGDPIKQDETPEEKAQREEKEIKQVKTFDKNLGHLIEETNWEYAPQWLKECFIHNFQEDNASAVYYRHVFLGFLERSNYLICVKKPSEQKRIKVGKKKEKSKSVVVSYEKIAKLTFIEYVSLLRKREIMPLEPHENLQIDRYHFDQNVSKELPVLARIEFFYHYFKKPERKKKFYNLRNEKFSSPAHFLGQELVNNFRETAGITSIKFALALGLNQELRIENSSQEFDALLSFDEVMKLIPRDKIDAYREYFDIYPTISDPAMGILRILKKVIYEWSGVKFKPRKVRKQKRCVTYYLYEIKKPGIKIWPYLTDGRAILA